MLKHHTQHLLDELRSELRKLAKGPSKATQLVAERSTDPIDEAQTTADIEMAITSLPEKPVFLRVAPWLPLVSEYRWNPQRWSKMTGRWQGSKYGSLGVWVSSIFQV
jgi:hypothetical protein